MKIAIYSRKSKYTGKGESIENQIDMCKDYIFQHMKNIKESDIFVYEDEGFSAKDLNRPKFQEMLKDCASHNFNYIVCYRLDRISRNVSDFSSLIEDLNSKNISFICIKEQFDTSSPMGRAMMYIASVFAQLERETIAERVRDNMLMLARTGRWLGGTTPTGFKSEKVENIIIDGKAKFTYKLKFDPDEVYIVKEIYEKFLQMGSVSAVGKYLIGKGIKSRSGKYFSNLSIKDILTNPVYCVADNIAHEYFVNKNSDVCFEKKDCNGKFGLISYNKRDYTKKNVPRNEESKWIIAIGKHPGIVIGTDWVNVQNKLHGTKKVCDKKHSNVHNDYSLLSGMIFCKKCGERMFSKVRHNGCKKLSYDYICSSKLKGNTALCDSQNLIGKQTDDLVCNYLMEYVNENSEIYNLLENLKNKTIHENEESDLDIIDKKIFKCHKELENLVTTLAQSQVNQSVIRAINIRADALDKTINELKTEKEQILKQNEIIINNDLQLDVIVKALAYFKDSFKEFDIYSKRELIKLLIEKIEWDGENLNIFIYGE